MYSNEALQEMLDAAAAVEELEEWLTDEDVERLLGITKVLLDLESKIESRMEV